jgi:hypothetical protein
VAVNPEIFRDALAQWPSGVTVVTTLADGNWHGMTASSFSSVSAEPPLVSVCLLKGIYTHDLIAKSGVFGINILAADQTELGKRFAGMIPEITDRFDGVDCHTSQTGVPLFDHALAWIDCRVVFEYEGGDHTIFVGEVLDAGNPRKSAPLLYHSRSWGQFADQLPERASVADVGVARLEAQTGVDLTTDKAALAAAGVAVSPAEVVVDSRDAAAVEATIAQQAEVGIERVVVLNAFDPDHHDAVLFAVSNLARGGFTQVVLDDTSADANPLIVRQRLVDVSVRIKPSATGVCLRDHAGLGLANALAALKSGVTQFDTALGGMGGLIATEDVLYLMELLNISTGASRPEAVEVARSLARNLQLPRAVEPRPTWML